MITNKPYIEHFPGKSSNIYSEYIESHKYDKFNKPNNLSIISVITPECLNSSCLNIQCENSNVDIINPLNDRFVKWNRYDKPKYILEGLIQSTTDYSLVLDGNDVLITQDLYNIIEDFKIFDCDILYNSTCYNSPKIILDDIDKSSMGKYRYLNAGVCIGKTDKLIEFYLMVKHCIDEDFHHYDSEQYYIKKVFGKIIDRDDIDINIKYDYENLLFKCMHNR